MLKLPALNGCKFCVWSGVSQRRPRNPGSLTECAEEPRTPTMTHHVPFLDWALDPSLPATVFVSCFVGQPYWLFGLSWERAIGAALERTAHTEKPPHEKGFLQTASGLLVAISLSQALPWGWEAVGSGDRLLLHLLVGDFLSFTSSLSWLIYFFSHALPFL